MEKVIEVVKGEDILLPTTRDLLSEEKISILREWIMEIIEVPGRSVAGDRRPFYFARCHRGENGRWRETSKEASVAVAKNLGGGLVLSRVEAATK